jgi:hypothetical protein
MDSPTAANHNHTMMGGRGGALAGGTFAGHHHQALGQTILLPQMGQGQTPQANMFGQDRIMPQVTLSNLAQGPGAGPPGARPGPQQQQQGTMTAGPGAPGTFNYQQQGMQMMPANPQQQQQQQQAYLTPGGQPQQFQFTGMNPGQAVGGLAPGTQMPRTLADLGAMGTEAAQQQLAAAAAGQQGPQQQQQQGAQQPWQVLPHGAYQQAGSMGMGIFPIATPLPIAAAGYQLGMIPTSLVQQANAGGAAFFPQAHAMFGGPPGNGGNGSSGKKSKKRKRRRSKKRKRRKREEEDEEQDESDDSSESDDDSDEY